MSVKTLEQVMAYIAREKCGCVTGATIDNPQHRKEVAKDVAAWVRDGRIVERVDSGYVRAEFGQCPKGIIKSYDRKHCNKCKFNI